MIFRIFSGCSWGLAVTPAISAARKSFTKESKPMSTAATTFSFSRGITQRIGPMVLLWGIHCQIIIVTSKKETLNPKLLYRYIGPFGLGGTQKFHKQYLSRSLAKGGPDRDISDIPGPKGVGFRVSGLGIRVSSLDIRVKD